MNALQTKSGQYWVWALVTLVLIVLGSLSSIDYRWSAYGGAAIGVLGGTAGACYGIRRLNLEEERALMWRFLLVLLLLMALFAIGFLLIPGYYRFLVFIPFGIGIFVLVRHTNRTRTDLHTAQQEHSGIASP